jgi:hypothetical protein
MEELSVYIGSKCDFTTSLGFYFNVRASYAYIDIWLLHLYIVLSRTTMQIYLFQQIISSSSKSVKILYGTTI